MKSLVQLFNEVGEGSKDIFSWEEGRPVEFGEGVRTTFSFTGQVQYVVYIVHNTVLEYVEISFGVVDLDTSKGQLDFVLDFQSSINKNEWSKVITTVMDILVTYVKKHRAAIDVIAFAPIKAHEEDYRRDKLYMAYINKNIHKLPNKWDIVQYGDHTIVYRDKQAVNAFLDQYY